MKLDDMTREQLKEEAKKRGIQKYHSWGKTDLLKAIAKFDHESGATINPADAQNEEEAKKQAEEPSVKEPAKQISLAATKWKEYFAKTGVTAGDFLARYPNHKFKTFISELL
jgi:hypothetical protein